MLDFRKVELGIVEKISVEGKEIKIKVKKKDLKIFVKKVKLINQKEKIFLLKQFKKNFLYKLKRLKKKECTLEKTFSK